MKHTPGPWYASPAGRNWWVTTNNGLAQTIACSAGTEWPNEPREANARLIAAAPELLKALMEIDAQLTGNLPVTKVVKEIAQEAIRLAGEDRVLGEEGEL